MSEETLRALACFKELCIKRALHSFEGSAGYRGYRVAKTKRMPYVDRSFSAKEL